MDTLKKLIPSLLTIANLVCGLAVLFLDLEYAVYLILLGAFLDLWDGLAARLLNAQSELGKQLDSLADLVTFCIAPAYLLFNVIDNPYNIICFVIPVTGALRLAKFNISDDQSYYFKGLATPASGFLFTGLIIAYNYIENISPIIIMMIVLITCLLNVSSIRMFSAKGIKKDPYSKIFIIALLAIFVVVSVINWKLALMIGVGSYISMSLVYHYLMRKVV
jgi:CDP-diacylglycerol--serine O-phosphatidyltransferase